MKKKPLWTKEFFWVLAFFVLCGSGFVGTASAAGSKAPKEKTYTSQAYTLDENGNLVAKADTKQVQPVKKVVADGDQKASIAYPTGNRETSSLWIEKIYPASVRTGKSYRYSLSVKNLTSLTLPNVVVAEQVPAGFELTTTDPKASRTEGGKAYWNLGNLNPNEEKLIVVEGRAGEKGELPCCTSASYDTPSLCVNTKVIQPSLKVDVSSTGQVTTCDMITLKIVATNTGDGTLRDVKVTSDLPSGVADLAGKKEVSANLGYLSPGESRDQSVLLQASKTGTYSFTAAAMGEGDISAKSGTVSTKVVKPVLSITATGRDKQYLGRDIKYEYKVTNNGDSAAERAVVEATVPAGVQIVSASDEGKIVGSKVKWNLGSVAPNTSKTLSINVNALVSGKLTTEASANAACSEAVVASTSTELVGVAGILLEMVDVMDPIEAGNIETYVIRVTNQGSAPDDNIRITASFDEGMEYISSTGATEGKGEGNSVSFGVVRTLAPKAVVEWKVKVKVSKEGTNLFKTTLTSDQITRAAEKVETTTVY